MNSLKTLTLALMLVILSVTGLRAEEISLELDRLNEEAKQAYYTANYFIALEKWEVGLKKARELDNKTYISKFLANLGAMSDRLGFYPIALEYYQQALVISRNINDKPGEGDHLTNLGNVFNQLAQYPKALEYFQDALKIHRELGDRGGEGADLTGIGNVYENRSQYQKALKYFQKALEIHRNLHDRHGKRGEATNLANIGNVYFYLNQHQKALDYFQQSLKIHSDLDMKYEIAGNLNSIGLVYEHFGQSQKALESYLRAQEIHIKIGDKRAEGNDLIGIGNVYTQFAQYQKALEYFQEALKIHREIDNKHDVGITMINMGVVYEKLGEYQKALHYFQGSVGIFKKIGSRDLWKAQSALGKTQAKLNQFEEAIEHYDQAINHLEKLRAGLSKKEDKLSFMPNRVWVYDEFIALLQTLHQQQPTKGYDRKALTIFERKQGRIFLEEMGKSGARRFADLPKEITQQERSLVHQLEKTQTDLTEEQAKPFLELNSTRIDSLTQRLSTIKEEQAALEARFAKEYPKYYALKYPKPAPLSILQNEVLQTGEMMLLYNVMEESTALWVISQEQFQMFRLPVGEKQLDEKVNGEKGVRTFLMERLSEFNEKSHELYQTLLPNAARQLIDKAETLYIVPTGALYALPFEALITCFSLRDHDKVPHYLIQDYAIVYLSSASLLKSLRDERRKKAPQPLLAFANPDYPACPKQDSSANKDKGGIAENTIAKLRIKGYQKSMGKCFLPPLLDTENEVQQIATILNEPEKDFENVLYVKKAASRQNLFKLNENGELDDYRYLMFSVHGFLPDEIPDEMDVIKQPMLALSMSDPYDETGYLTMANAFTLQLNADFVNLSACNSGIDNYTRGEGMWGLTRAFMYAGTPAVAVGLWKLDMKATKDFNINLFKNLKAGQKLAKAVQQAKVTMIKSQAMHPDNKDAINDPYYWAPFVVYGEGGELRIHK